MSKNIAYLIWDSKIIVFPQYNILAFFKIYTHTTAIVYKADLIKYLNLNREKVIMSGY